LSQNKKKNYGQKYLFHRLKSLCLRLCRLENCNHRLDFSSSQPYEIAGYYLRIIVKRRPLVFHVIRLEVPLDLRRDKSGVFELGVQ
jgi:hypothetical protein